MLKCIAVSDLRIGMFIHEFCCSWMDHPFWKTRFLLNNEKDLQRIRACGMQTIWVDVSKGLDIAQGRPSVSPEQVNAEVDAELLASVSTVPPHQHQWGQLSDEVQNAATLCARSKDAVVSMFADIRMGKALDMQRLNQQVNQITDSVMMNPDAFIALARLKRIDNYTYMHSVAVCALMIALARQLGLDEDSVREAGLGGLFHDVGKVTLPRKLLSKPGKLTTEEFNRVRGHPVSGAQLLGRLRQVSPQVLDVTLHHHERLDGSGYPDGLVGSQISLFARMAAICDVYDALTSDRAYKPGWDPALVLRKMVAWKGQFDIRLLHAFVKAIGIYPVGSLVRLKSGLIGVVVAQSAASLLQPLVKVFFCTTTRSVVAHRIIDLSERQIDETIVGLECAQKWGFTNLDRLWLDNLTQGQG
ncbi:HD-GYP domain-containing protein [Ectopseudomonas mendocina]|uniref:HD-GYP domain-containing protein n=1 Tax=Ectopseudomonas mendocina TaxID=300 RepID=A0ABZ2RH43_ECTME